MSKATYTPVPKRASSCSQNKAISGFLTSLFAARITRDKPPQGAAGKLLTVIGIDFANTIIRWHGHIIAGVVEVCTKISAQ